MPRIRLQVGFALKAVETRQACAAYEYLMAAILTANALPKPVRLALRDHIREHTKRRKGRQWDLMRAYATFLDEPLETVRMREWQELHRLRVVPPLAPFIEDEADEADDGGADEAVERCPDAFGLGAMEGAGGTAAQQSGDPDQSGGGIRSVRVADLWSRSPQVGKS